MITAIAAAAGAQPGSAVAPVACASDAPVARGRATREPLAVPIEVTNNHVYVPMCSGSRRLWLLLDTGAGASLLDLKTAESLGFALGDQFQIAGAGAGTTRGATIAGASVRLAEDPSVSLTVVMAMELDGLAPAEGRPAHGILGHNFISRGVLEIDYHGRLLRLHDSATFRYAGTGARIPLRMVDNHPHVDAELVLADGGRVAADFVVDVGSSLALALTKPLVDANRLRQRVGPTIRRPSGRGAGGLSWAEIGRVARLRIGPAELAAPVVNMYGDSAGVFSTGRYFQGNIGGDVLRRFTVFLDYARREMILEPGPDVAEPFETDMSGALFLVDTAAVGIRITHVTAGTPAAESGLAPGDVITRINGRPAIEVGMDGLRRLLVRAGATMDFTVRRDGRARAVRVLLRRLA